MSVHESESRCRRPPAFYRQDGELVAKDHTVSNSEGARPWRVTSARTPTAVLTFLLLLAVLCEPSPARAAAGFFRVAEQGGRSGSSTRTAVRSSRRASTSTTRARTPLSTIRGRPSTRRCASTPASTSGARPRGVGCAHGASTPGGLRRRAGGRCRGAAVHGLPGPGAVGGLALDRPCLPEGALHDSRPGGPQGGPLRNDRRLVGYFLDNELKWYEGSLSRYWAREPGRERLKKRLFSLLQQRYAGDLEAFRRDFRRGAAAATLRRPRGAVGPHRGAAGTASGGDLRLRGAPRRGALPHPRGGHPRGRTQPSPPGRSLRQRLLAGRGARRGPPRRRRLRELRERRAGWLDLALFLETLHRVTGKPLLVSETYVAARENQSGNRNSNGHYLVVENQAERAATAEGLVTYLARLPYVVGYRWFQWSDQPSAGREDGEDFNMGLVDLDDRPYDLLTAATRSRHPPGPRSAPRRRSAARPDGGGRGVGRPGAAPLARWRAPRLGSPPSLGAGSDSQQGRRADRRLLPVVPAGGVVIGLDVLDDAPGSAEAASPERDATHRRRGPGRRGAAPRRPGPRPRGRGGSRTTLEPGARGSSGARRSGTSERPPRSSSPRSSSAAARCGPAKPSRSVSRSSWKATRRSSLARRPPRGPEAQAGRGTASLMDVTLARDVRALPDVPSTLGPSLALGSVLVPAKALLLDRPGCVAWAGQLAASAWQDVLFAAPSAWPDRRPASRPTPPGRAEMVLACLRRRGRIGRVVHGRPRRRLRVVTARAVRADAPVRRRRGEPPLVADRAPHLDQRARLRPRADSLLPWPFGSRGLQLRSGQPGPPSS